MGNAKAYKSYRIEFEDTNGRRNAYAYRYRKDVMRFAFELASGGSCVALWVYGSTASIGNLSGSSETDYDRPVAAFARSSIGVIYRVNVKRPVSA